MEQTHAVSRNFKEFESDVAGCGAQGMANKHIYAYKHIFKKTAKNICLKKTISGGSHMLISISWKTIFGTPHACKHMSFEHDRLG
jgi:hypothetical protein